MWKLGRCPRKLLWKFSGGSAETCGHLCGNLAGDADACVEIGGVCGNTGLKRGSSKVVSPLGLVSAEFRLKFPQIFRRVSAQFPESFRKVSPEFPQSFRRVSADFPQSFRKTPLCSAPHGVDTLCFLAQKHVQTLLCSAPNGVETLRFLAQNHEETWLKSASVSEV